MSFGEEFGKLIRRRRGIEGLTQQALAVTAFGDESHKTKISDIENGKVDVPHAKTIDALAVALDISERELGQLATDNRGPYYIDTLADYFDFSDQVTAIVSLSGTMDNAVALSHNCPWKVKIQRFEFFVDEKSLILLTESGSRRPVGMEIPEYILEQLILVDSVRTILWERGPQPMSLEHHENPLKIFR